ncbi:MAG: hypothetical protein PHX83_17515 [Acidobacteriia bacterium]|nr:hypothetical protein [Terriglobia bacterium]
MKLIGFALVWLAGCWASLGEGKMKMIGVALVWLAGWAWALLSGVGGLMLLIHEGPLPVTNGWFAMFSGIAACPLTATLLKKHAGLSVAGWAQFAVALLIFLAGRVAVVLVLHRPFLPQ